jgi:hypothetical protein
MENLDLACTYSHLSVLMKFVKNLTIVMDKLCGMQKGPGQVFFFFCFRKLSLVMRLAKKRRCGDQY